MDGILRDAAVISDPIVAPAYTPALQLKAWKTSGMVVARRPPKIMALIGTPFRSSQSGSMVGHWEAGAVNRAFGCAALAPVAFAIWGVHFFPRQSRHSSGGVSVIPSHQTPPSGVKATFVKIVFLDSVAIAFGFVFAEVPGATHPRVAIMKSTGKCKSVDYDRSLGECWGFEKGQSDQMPQALRAALPNLCNAPLN